MQDRIAKKKYNLIILGNNLKQEYETEQETLRVHVK